MEHRAAIPLLVCIIAAAYWFLLPVQQPDFATYLLPWLDAVSREGAFADAFSNYTAGYLTVLWATARLREVIGDVAAIKLAAVIGTAFCGGGVAAILRASGRDLRYALTGGLVLAASPAAMLNGIAWGQADAFYAGFLMFAVAAAIKGRPHQVAVLFCLALSFKMQAVFAAPFVAGFLFRSGNRRAIVTGAIALLPCYLLVNAPYLAAGRPVWDVLRIYLGQAVHFHALSLGAPNPWMLIEGLAGSAKASFYGPGVVVGLFLGVAISSVIAWHIALAKTMRTDRILHWAAACLIVIPFVLPKMHERFFFTGEALLLTAALLDRRFVVPALTVQLASVSSYAMFHDTLGLRGVIGFGGVWLTSLIAMSATVFAVAVRPIRRKPQPASSCGSIGATVSAPALTAGARPAARGSMLSA